MHQHIIVVFQLNKLVLSLGIVKAYTTRVGGGPSQANYFVKLVKLEKLNEFGTVTWKKNDVDGLMQLY